MDPIIGGSLIGAGGGLVSSAMSYLSTKEQMRFQERMSNSAYQRAAEDMRKAGLNPMLMYSKAQPASTPQGASTTYENPLREVPGAMAKREELRLTSARIANETKTTDANVAEAQARTNLINQQAANAAQTYQLGGKELERAPDVARKLKLESDAIVREMELKASQIATNASQRKELEQRARREQQIADALTAVVPVLVKGGKDIQTFVNKVESGALGDYAYKEVQDFKEALQDMATFKGLRNGASEVWNNFKNKINSIKPPAQEHKGTTSSTAEGG